MGLLPLKPGGGGEVGQKVVVMEGGAMREEWWWSTNLSVLQEMKKALAFDFTACKLCNYVFVQSDCC